VAFCESRAFCNGGYVWGFNECKNFAELIPMLAEVEEAFSLRGFLTCWISVEIQKYLSSTIVLCHEDIELYVSPNANELLYHDAAAR
jgi:hypothetical protein